LLDIVALTNHSSNTNLVCLKLCGQMITIPEI